MVRGAGFGGERERERELEWEQAERGKSLVGLGCRVIVEDC